MYNLVKFIIKYHFLILFLFLELIASFIIFNNNKYHKVKYLNTANFLSGSIYNFQSGIKEYFKLKEVNEALAKENALLQEQILEITYMEVPKLFNDTVFVLDSLVLDTIQQMHYIPAKVINNSLNKQFNMIYINKGKKDGFYEDMGIINKDGVVGVVRNVSNNYANITPIINRDFNINAKIKNSGFFGNLSWDGLDPKFGQLYDIPNHIIPSIGDTILSSGYSQIFDEGHIIGYIEEVHSVPGKSFINIQVRLAVEFGNLNYIYGIENSIKNNLDSLVIEQQ
ncbi:MAG: rod shape-determining protein MreC [Chitinophagales bacterium]|nr:rod shape-determining protein MreC [Chitinophagales bacterium]